MLHESEAKKLHCPLGRQHFETTTDMCSANRWKTRNGNLQYTRCLARECMIWVQGSLNGYGRCGLVKEFK